MDLCCSEHKSIAANFDDDIFDRLIHTRKVTPKNESGYADKIA